MSAPHTLSSPPSCSSNPQPAAQEPVAATRRLRLAYLTTEYPKVSHTFIRREIVELERRGHHVMRLAIRDSGGAVADAADAQEAERTFHVLSQPKWKFLLAVAVVMLRWPVRWFRALRMTLQMNRASNRGLVRHLAYLVEAALLLRVLEREKIQHVHVHFGTNAAAVARLVRCLGGPSYSMTVHGPGEFDSPVGFSLGAKTVDAAFVIAITDYCAAQLRRWVPYEHWRKIHIVRCSVGEQFFMEDSPIDPNSRTLVCIGRLTPQKGQLLLVDAIKRLADEGVDAKLVLAGDGEMRSEIERRIMQAGVQDRVQITGWVDEAAVRQHLHAARALVMASFAEGLPVVIMEAMAMGRPVIATTIAGIPELVRAGENGWLVTAGNIDELTDAMRDALQASAERLAAMGQAGRQRVRERHLTSTETARLEGILQSYLHESAGN